MRSVVNELRMSANRSGVITVTWPQCLDVVYCQRTVGYSETVIFYEFLSFWVFSGRVVKYWHFTQRYVHIKLLYETETLLIYEDSSPLIGTYIHHA